MTGPPRPSNRGRSNDPRLDEALIMAAIEVLNEVGYAAFTTAEVARRAGASTASIYRRWPSKQALTAAVASHIAAAELGDIDTGCLEGDLRELLRRKQRIIDASAGPALLSLMGHAAHDAGLRRVLHDNVYRVTRKTLEDLTARAASRHELDEGVDAAEVSIMALTLIGTALARSVFVTSARSQTPNERTTAEPDNAELEEVELRMLLRTFGSIAARHR